MNRLESDVSPPDGTIIALIDPDMIFMRPLTEKIKSQPVLYTKPVKRSTHLFFRNYPLWGCCMMVVFIVGPFR